jgi:NAD+-dependent protein deacetylase sirtuin 1
MAWVQKQINQGVDPRDVLQKLGNLSSHIPVSLDDTTLWKIIVSVLSEPPRREKLSHVNTMTDVVKLLKEAKNIIVLTGAGVITLIITNLGKDFIKYALF